MVVPGFIYWDVGPVIAEIGPFTFRWYGLLFGLAFLFGYYMVGWMFRQEGKPERYLDPLLVYMIVGTVLGARLGHVLFYDPGYYFSQPVEILKVWQAAWPATAARSVSSSRSTSLPGGDRVFPTSGSWTASPCRRRSAGRSSGWVTSLTQRSWGASLYSRIPRHACEGVRQPLPLYSLHI